MKNAQSWSIFFLLIFSYKLSEKRRFFNFLSTHSLLRHCYGSLPIKARLTHGRLFDMWAGMSPTISDLRDVRLAMTNQDLHGRDDRLRLSLRKRWAMYPHSLLVSNVTLWLGFIEMRLACRSQYLRNGISLFYAKAAYSPAPVFRYDMSLRHRRVIVG